VPKELRQMLRNAGPVPLSLDAVEDIEAKLNLSLASPECAYIFVGSGRFEVVSAAEAQLWREERRDGATTKKIPMEPRRPMEDGALVVGGALEPPFFHALQAASGVKTYRAEVTPFANGEILPKVGAAVRWKDVFLVYQADGVSNESLVELMLQVDAVRRAGASRITVIAPSFPYARADRKNEEGTPISAAAVSRILQSQGVQQFICFDMHAGQVEGFADVPIENFSALPLLASAIAEKYPDEEFIVALPDEGMGKRLKDDKTRSLIAENLGPNTTFLQMAKDRIEVNEVNSAHIKGDRIDLSGKTVVILDDMIDTGKTTRLAARALLQAGARKVIAAATHGIFSGDAIESFRSDRELINGRLVHPVSEIFVTDSIPLRRAKADLINVVSLADYLGDVLHSLATRDGRALKDIMLTHSGRRVV
jgi:ribose-phosphate pyrophosphokinase